MEFRLVYEGDLKPKGKAKLSDIHRIRTAFHSQLKALWATDPLAHFQRWQKPRDRNDQVTALHQVGDRKFITLVHESLSIRAHLDVLLLRAEQREGALIHHGDIDNRLKTLFDALRPPMDTELRALSDEFGDFDPMFCLLQDDKLITKVSVEVDRLLYGQQKNTVAIVKVSVRASVVTMANLGIVA